MNVRLGEWDLETELDCHENDPSYCSRYKTYGVVDITIHEKYRRGGSSHHNDIALLRVSDDIDFDDFVQPICLPMQPSLWTKDYTGSRFDVAGWGEFQKLVFNGSKFTSFRFIPQEKLKT